MGQTKDFRIRTTVASTPGAGKVAYYADKSGILNYVNSAGTNYVASTTFDVTNANAVVSTGYAVIIPGQGSPWTGKVIGTTGTYKLPTFMGEPNWWIPVLVSGLQGAIPVFTRT